MYIYSIYFFLTDYANAQSCLLHGYLSAQGSREPIIGAYVYAPGLNTGTSTNAQGYYALPLPCNEAVGLIFQSLGYRADSLQLTLQGDSLLNKALAVYSLTTVEVTAPPLSPKLGQKGLSMQQLENIPVLLGEPDPLKAISLLPGVAPGVEGTVGLYVRGGGADQNLFLLDGSTVYNNGHIFGFVSVFHPSAIKNIKLYKGYFPARYGGRLSSVMDIIMKDGNRTEPKREATLGAINSSLTLEGPVAKGKGAYLLSGRAAHSGMLSLFTLPSYPRGEPWLFAGMYDFNGKLSYFFPDNSKLSLSFYAGEENRQAAGLAGIYLVQEFPAVRGD